MHSALYCDYDKFSNFLSSYLDVHRPRLICEIVENPMLPVVFTACRDGVPVCVPSLTFALVVYVRHAKFIN